MSHPLRTIPVRSGDDVVLARRGARELCGLLGFPLPEQTRVAAAASELARLVAGGPGGTVEFSVEDGPPQSLLILAGGPGLDADGLRRLLDGHGPEGSLSEAGPVMARRLMDRCSVAPSGPGAAILMAKDLPRGLPPLGPGEIRRVVDEMSRRGPPSPSDEVREQNRELLKALDELRSRQVEMDRINRELDETNRGVVALYAELDENATALRRASDLKSRFLSDMSHEFRSPLNSILSLTRFLIERRDGDLTAEQERQVALIRKSSEGLLDLVNDLLDLAKVESGRVTIRAEEFRVGSLFGALRGMFRPLLANDAVSLVFEDPAGLPPLHSDESKVAQVLRNFLSNALKFTERGEVRVSATPGPDGSVTFAVADTGIGIAPGDQATIFEEFGQVDGPIQRRVRGTGLGLSLSRRLVELLGGRVWLRSEPGAGSTFFATFPPLGPREGGPRGPSPGPDPVGPPPPPASPAGPPTILIVDDDEADRYVLRGLLVDLGFDVAEASCGLEALRMARDLRPSAVFLDLGLPDIPGLDVLGRLAADPSAGGPPVIIRSSRAPEAEERLRASGAAEILLKADAPRGIQSDRIRAALLRAGLTPAPREGPRDR